MRRRKETETGYSVNLSGENARFKVFYTAFLYPFLKHSEQLQKNIVKINKSEKIMHK